MDESQPYILPRLEDRVLWLALNRPDHLNGLSVPMVQALDQALIEAAEDPGVGAIVLHGQGRSFCGGGDIHGLIETPPDAAAIEAEARACARTAWRLHELPKPTIAMIHGAAAGGGLALAVACDVRIAADTARLTFAYPRIGLPGDLGVSYFLTRILGPARALSFCLTCAITGADDALALGLVDRLAPEAGLEAATRTLATGLAQGPGLAWAGIKANLAAAATGDWAAALAVEARNFARCRLTEDHREACRAFLAKRPARFVGR